MKKRAIDKILDSKTHYTVKELFKTEAQIKIADSIRQQGKSYSGRALAVHNAYQAAKNGKANCRFIYLRRRRSEAELKKDIDGWTVETPVSDLTDGEWEYIKYKGGCFFLAKMVTLNKKIKVLNNEGEKDEIDVPENKEVVGPLIGYMSILAEDCLKKSVSKPDVANGGIVIFEEYNPIDGDYLEDEVRLLFNYLSTIFRDKPINILMLGNLESIWNPYAEEFGIDENQEEGTIRVIKFEHTDSKGERVVNKVAYERVKPIVSNRNLLFGKTSSELDRNEYHTISVPHLPMDKQLFDYKILHEMYVENQDKGFVCYFLHDDVARTFEWFVFRCRSEELKNEYKKLIKRHIIVDKYEASPYTTRSFRNPLVENERVAMNLLKEEKIMFSDNLTGTAFLQLLRLNK